ncbi:MAG: hypothetical protein MK135_06635, partial [Polyangiaceae bacterium]|nr:hypothetical protein [Polyangiaceae bacterium]
MNESASPAVITQAFRRGRWRVATLDGVGGLLLLCPAVLWAGGSLRSLSLAFAVICSVVFLSYRGREIGRLALAAVMLGLLPIALALSTLTIHQACVIHGCSSYCVPACAAGGVLSGALAGRMGARSSAPFLTVAALVG